MIADGQSRRKTYLRLGGLLLFVAVVVVIGLSPKVRAQFEAENLRTIIEAAGAWGFLLYIVAFLVGLVLYIPGIVFVGVGVFAWGPWVGIALGYGTGVLGVTAHFSLLRLIGGSPLAAGAPGRRWYWVQRVLDDLEAHPVRSVAILRVIGFMSPPLNTALALTGLKARDHFLGTALGLVFPVIIAAGLFDWLFS
ncbi:MAG: VTT domain-containing protein [Deltaproteobacteria bacterium]|nr:VTT domain-containing protein [Deltaproteobacteria bacterium]